MIGNVRISIAIFSYNGGLYFGVTGDYDSSGDIDVLTRGIETAAGQLLGAVGSAVAHPSVPARPGRTPDVTQST